MVDSITVAANENGKRAVNFGHCPCEQVHFRSGIGIDGKCMVVELTTLYESTPA